MPVLELRLGIGPKSENDIKWNNVTPSGSVLLVYSFL